MKKKTPITERFYITRKKSRLGTPETSIVDMDNFSKKTEVLSCQLRNDTKNLSSTVTL